MILKILCRVYDILKIIQQNETRQAYSRWERLMLLVVEIGKHQIQMGIELGSQGKGLPRKVGVQGPSAFDTQT